MFLGLFIFFVESFNTKSPEKKSGVNFDFQG